MAELIIRTLLSSVIVILMFNNAEGLLRRCFTCRSRGDLGTCKDPFKLNGTDIDVGKGVSATPCASGWCGKILEGGNAYKEDDYGIATQRMCLQRSPSDNEERCAYTVFNYKKVYMCFCLGDLCNSGTVNSVNYNILTISITFLYFIYKMNIL